jgi:hypothetical protein
VFVKRKVGTVVCMVQACVLTGLDVNYFLVQKVFLSH